MTFISKVRENLINPEQYWLYFCAINLYKLVILLEKDMV